MTFQLLPGGHDQLRMCDDHCERHDKLRANFLLNNVALIYCTARHVPDDHCLVRQLQVPGSQFRSTARVTVNENGDRTMKSRVAWLYSHFLGLGPRESFGENFRLLCKEAQKGEQCFFPSTGIAS